MRLLWPRPPRCRCCNLLGPLRVGPPPSATSDKMHSLFHCKRPRSSDVIGGLLGPILNPNICKGTGRKRVQSPASFPRWARGRDEPIISRSVMEPIRNDHPLRRLFSGLIEHAFCAEVGLCDPALTQYLVDLLVDFTHVERFSEINRAQGKRLEQIATLLAVMSDEKPQSTTERERAVYRRIGDYTLFWAGVYPEQLGSAHRGRSDVFVDYVSQGKRSYAIVSRLADDGDVPPASLFRHLSEDFESCMYGLGLVRRGWEESHEFTDYGSGDLLY